MGNKSKRIQGRVLVPDTQGLPCGSKRIDAGYSGRKKERHFRECSTKVTCDFETTKRLRREARRAKKKLNSSQHAQPDGGAAAPAAAREAAHELKLCVERVKIGAAKRMAELTESKSFQDDCSREDIRMQFTVNRNIQKIIHETGRKQGDVADRAGISRAVFSEIVRCKRKVYADEVVPIAVALQVTVEDLFQEVGA